MKSEVRKLLVLVVVLAALTYLYSEAEKMSGLAQVIVTILILVLGFVGMVWESKEK